MNNVKQPTKEQVRHYMAQRQSEHKVPPSLQEIRRRLGWECNLTQVRQVAFSA